MQKQPRVKEGIQEVITLDKTDKKILRALFTNKRQSFNQIAKKVRVSKEVVNYRLSRLKQRGILQGQITIIDNNKLGFDMHFMYLKLQRIGKEREKEIINYFVNHDFVKALATCTGNWDMYVVFSSRDLNHYNKILREFENFCSINLKQYKIATFLEEQFFPYNYLSFEGTILDKKVKIEKFIPDSTDLIILKILSKNPMLSLVEISQTVHLTPEAISYRIRKLINQKVIVNFFPLINVSLLGYHWYTVSLILKNVTEKREKELINYLKQLLQIVCVIRTVGQWHLDIDFHVKTSQEFREILMEIREQFSDIINDFETQLVFNDYKYTHMPKGFLQPIS